MLKCRLCAEEFDDDVSAGEHVELEHADVCDDKLQEYIPDSIRDAIEELIEGQETE